MAKRSTSPPAKWKRVHVLPTSEELQWLQSPQGQAVCRAMATEEPADTPAAITQWRKKLSAEQVAAAWQQVELRQLARSKFSRADEMLFDRLGLEQATDEQVGAYKARRFARFNRVNDLCCGIGGDTLALAGQSEVTAVDLLGVKVMMAEHNAAVYGRSITALPGDVRWNMPDAEAAHIDPDRRPEGARRHQPDAGRPGLDVVGEVIAQYTHVAVKLSPGADFSLLPFEAEIELISHGGDCKQAVAWTGDLHKAMRRATVLPSGETISADNPAELPWPEPQPIQPGHYLYEPDPAVIRADLVGLVGRTQGLAPVDSRIAWLSGPAIADTALLRPFEIIDVIDFSSRRMRTWLGSHNVGRLEIKTRGFAARPETLLKQFKLTGRDNRTLFVTRIAEKPVAILTRRIESGM